MITAVFRVLVQATCSSRGMHCQSNPSELPLQSQFKLLQFLQKLFEAETRLPIQEGRDARTVRPGKGLKRADLGIGAVWERRQDSNMVHEGSRSLTSAGDEVGARQRLHAVRNHLRAHCHRLAKPKIVI